MKIILLFLAVALALMMCNVRAQAVTIPAYYDFNCEDSPTQPGYTGVEMYKVYNVTDGYGWDETNIPAVGDTGPLEGTTALTRDYAANNKAYGTCIFNIDVPNGTYTVTLTFFNKLIPMDGVNVSAEGESKISNLSVGTDSPARESFLVTVSDTQLNLAFSGTNTGPGSSEAWYVNGVEVVPIPSSVLLLGSGILGLGALKWWRKRS